MKKMLFLAGFLCVFLSGCHKRSTSSGRMGESLYTMQLHDAGDAPQAVLAG